MYFMSRCRDASEGGKKVISLVMGVCKVPIGRPSRAIWRVFGSSRRIRVTGGRGGRGGGGLSLFN